MTVSIVIPNYNGIKYIEGCINSLLDQSLKDFEIIVIDNASTDGSYELIKSKYSFIRLERLEKNYGFCKAVNEGIKISKGEYVVLLNNDTEVEHNWLYSLYRCIAKNNKIFSCSSKMIRYNERNLIDDAGDEFTIIGWAYKMGDGFSIDKYISNRKIFSSCGGAAIYRKCVFEEIGYFDEKFFAYLEDVDISYRAKIYGYINLFCSDAKVYHIGSATSGSKYNSFKVRLAARNNIFLIYKNMPFFQVLLNLAFIILGTVIKLVFFTIRGFGRDYIKGINEGFRQLKNITKTQVSYKKSANYISIELELIINTFKYILQKMAKK